MNERIIIRSKKKDNKVKPYLDGHCDQVNK